MVPSSLFGNFVLAECEKLHCACRLMLLLVKCTRPMCVVHSGRVKYQLQLPAKITLLFKQLGFILTGVVRCVQLHTASVTMLLELCRQRGKEVEGRLFIYTCIS